ncbi:hypothetical protein AMATHDRAFT_63174 [Amanita thiersii Skay4041]|uniref:Uncharacterized protein n=1 Tax=Amanita thiersii Skay4041 TaxID=703135 RepID=A0A2A9NJH4_9AGAR|nr:hypothetical protein AMATHDRAFT_63174 [Amanita thiersii Skay4041]
MGFSKNLCSITELLKDHDECISQGKTCTSVPRDSIQKGPFNTHQHKPVFLPPYARISPVRVVSVIKCRSMYTDMECQIRYMHLIGTIIAFIGSLALVQATEATVVLSTRCLNEKGCSKCLSKEEIYQYGNQYCDNWAWPTAMAFGLGEIFSPPGTLWDSKDDCMSAVNRTVAECYNKHDGGVSFHAKGLGTRRLVVNFCGCKQYTDYQQCTYQCPLRQDTTLEA